MHLHRARKHLASVRAVQRLIITALCISPSAAMAQLSFEEEPINYGTATVNDPIAELQVKIDAGEASLDFDDAQGYLPALIDALGIKRSTQLLVFSKTSFQLKRISPRRPRALYFSDEVYVGWCQNGDVVEITSVDPENGPIYYTLAQNQVDRPKFVRDKGQCLTCHASSRTEGVPGPLVRSVYADRSGQPVLGTETFTISHASPLEERWGGWYVTGTHGRQRHLGNEVVTDKAQPESIDTEAGANVTALSERFDVEPYLTPHSDIIALMVLEHQTQAQNLITRAGYEARTALWYDSVMNDALDRPEDYISDSTKRRIDTAVEKLVKYMLFLDEVKLKSRLKGTSAFTQEFAVAGRRDARGRSLRDFDLRRRIFKYPCSYLVYSASFDALPPPVKEGVYRLMWEVLSGKKEDKAYAHLSKTDRTSILEILRETKGDLPTYWAGG